MSSNTIKVECPVSIVNGVYQNVNFSLSFGAPAPVAPASDCSSLEKRLAALELENSALKERVAKLEDQLKACEEPEPEEESEDEPEPEPEPAKPVRIVVKSARKAVPVKRSPPVSPQGGVFLTDEQRKTIAEELDSNEPSE